MIDRAMKPTDYYVIREFDVFPNNLDIRLALWFKQDVIITF